MLSGIEQVYSDRSIINLTVNGPLVTILLHLPIKNSQTGEFDYQNYSVSRLNPDVLESEPDV